MLAFSQKEESAATVSISKPGTPTTLFKPNAVACIKNTHSEEIIIIIIHQNSFLHLILNPRLFCANNPIVFTFAYQEAIQVGFVRAWENNLSNIFIDSSWIRKIYIYSQ